MKAELFQKFFRAGGDFHSGTASLADKFREGFGVSAGNVFGD